MTISSFGSQVGLIAVPLTAAAFLHASAMDMGLFFALSVAPGLLFGLHAGVLIDRWSHKTVLLTGDFVRAVVLLAIPVLWTFGHLSLPYLYAATFVIGVATVFYEVAFYTYVPTLVCAEDLVAANAKLEGSKSAAALFGPGIAGLAVGLLRAPVAIALDGLSFVASWWFVRRIENHHVELSAKSRVTESTWKSLRAGCSYVMRDRFLAPIAFCAGAANFFRMIQGSALMLYQVQVLHMSPTQIGLVTGLGNAGLLVSSAASPQLLKRFGVAKTLAGSAILMTTPLILVPFVPHAGPVVPLICVQFVFSVGLVTFTVNQVSLRQHFTPHEMRSRMNAVMRFMEWGAAPFGALLGGLIATEMGLRMPLIVAGVGSLLAILPLLALRVPATSDEAVEEDPEELPAYLRAEFAA